MDQATAVTDRVHRQATVAPLGEVAGLLQDVLSRRLVAYIVGVKDGKTVTRWATGEVTEIRSHEMEQRLRTTFEIALLLLGEDSPQVARAWFIGLNPRLNEVAPVDAIREGRLQEALAAAKAFTAAAASERAAVVSDLSRLLAAYPEVERVGRAVYDEEGLEAVLLRPADRFDGLSGLDLLRQGRAADLVSALAADYEAVG